jgi:hypothetical protein
MRKTFFKIKLKLVIFYNKLNSIINKEKSFKKAFDLNYQNKLWGMDGKDSLSGGGSNIERAINFQKILLEYINNNNVENIFDCSCGDWNWMKDISSNFKNYIGVDYSDTVIKMNSKFSSDKIKFKVGDCESHLVDSSLIFDICILRHTIGHLPTHKNLSILNAIKLKSKSLIIESSSIEDNYNLTFDGVSARPINLLKEPYFELLGEPTFFYPETENSSTKIFIYKFNNL